AKALAMAKSNLDRHGFGERTRCMEGDLFAVLSTQEQRCFDAIVSNPPYISESDWTTLQPEVRDFEPSMALRAGPQGLNLIQSIVKQAPTWLKPEGWLLMEIGSTQGAEVLALAETCQEWGKSWIGKDYAQLDRFLVAQAHR
ncbi:MAG: peptide chain release factor N(5)-glutamine methyltransferase, partial [Myxococcota bacterium]